MQRVSLNIFFNALKGLLRFENLIEDAPDYLHLYILYSQERFLRLLMFMFHQEMNKHSGWLMLFLSQFYN